MLTDRVILVTGGSRGIGRACVLEAVRQGARVVFCSRQDGPDSRAVEAEGAALAGPGVAIGVAADIADEASVLKMFEVLHNRFGTLDGVVNNAAISREQLLVPMTTEEWDSVLAANLTGSFLVARESLRSFLTHNRNGSIVSIGTLSQYGISGNASYATSKGGLLGLTRQIASQYSSRGITSNMVVSGYVETALSASVSAAAARALIDGSSLRRAGLPEEIAAVVTFLLSPEAAALNGQVIHATGGLREVPA
jgi:3-oxoacyl-[acyl-carrier protein] reductase